MNRRSVPVGPTGCGHKTGAAVAEALVWLNLPTQISRRSLGGSGQLLPELQRAVACSLEEKNIDKGSLGS
jgi:hypothetical protein